MNLKLMTTIIVLAFAATATASFDYAALDESQASATGWQLEATGVEPTLPASAKKTDKFVVRSGKWGTDDEDVDPEDVLAVKPGNGNANGIVKNVIPKNLVPGNGNWEDVSSGVVQTPTNGDATDGPSATPLPSSMTLGLIGVSMVGLLRKRHAA
ncbi:hypothetical protein STSP2_02656 [Anaerohalosphaera lusitana]|uniref:PEP-CTERM protein-sorting domain-containing protein n=1 Tax=Anaerohalosphaera lusitana TaxID=1936003 RepID=A0A1U9NPN1_9BACT|nr:hypothetical protein [Anaerohalosphaera lusitana]AQT69466.1 hypothetical protein STSP2_02656 [Anaerohalosphaera lusitana]